MVGFALCGIFSFLGLVLLVSLFRLGSEVFFHAWALEAAAAGLLLLGPWCFWYVDAVSPSLVQLLFSHGIGCSYVALVWPQVAAMKWEFLLLWNAITAMECYGVFTAIECYGMQLQLLSRHVAAVKCCHMLLSKVLAALVPSAVRFGGCCYEMGVFAAMECYEVFTAMECSGMQLLYGNCMDALEWNMYGCTWNDAMKSWNAAMESFCFNHAACMDALGMLLWNCCYWR
ncbi:hypothetical protein U1Q18_021520 [Sarracenia purpurea var. burkii]